MKHDELDRALAALPERDLDPARAEALRRRALAELREAHAGGPLRWVPRLAPVLVAGGGVLYLRWAVEAAALLLGTG